MQAAAKNGWSVLKRYEKECGRSLCGCGAVQHVGAYSVRLGFRERQGTEEFEGKPTMTCRINRHVIGEDLVILCISGRITGQDVDILRDLLDQEKSAVAIDLKDVLLVDREAVEFLARCDSNAVELRNCPAYIREWIKRERERTRMRRRKGTEGSDDIDNV
jgi:hypothetical protein